MKKIFLLLCVLGTVLPYYYLITFLSNNNWSMDGFWNDIFFGSSPVSMIAMDLSVAATTFLVFFNISIQTKKNKNSKIYCLPFFGWIFSSFSSLSLRQLQG